MAISMGSEFMLHKGVSQVAPDKTPALSYNSQLHVVRVDLSRGVALQSSLPPSDLIERARSKLEKIQNEGKIDFFEIYEDCLETVWHALRESENLSDDTKISLTLAAGAPIIEGLQVVNSTVDKPGVLVSTSAPIDLKKIPIEWIRFSILKVAKENFIHETLFKPHLSSALLRIAAGDVLDHFLIESRSDLPTFSTKDRPFSVFANRKRFEAVAYIHDLNAMQSEPAIDRLCALAGKAVDKLQSDGAPDLLVLKSEMTKVIRLASSGPERLGIGMPLPVLAAMTDLSKLLTKKFLDFAVSEDKMTVVISDFDLDVYEDPEFEISKDFIINQLKKSDLKGEVTDKDLAILIESASKRENLEGQVASRGIVPVTGSDPYIHLVYQDAPKLTSENETINIRESQQRSIVQAGQMVAEIRYNNPEVIGMNVLGQAIQPEPGPSMEVILGEGVQQLQPGKFFAECGGVPQCEEGNKISLIKSHVHEGDVNLKSGNIYFDGPVEIKGSVDTGSLVRVKGPLKIYGSVTGGTVISKEPIEVVESIVTGSQGKVVCSTHIKADFIENSIIECDGSVVVMKSLVSSDVVAGDYIHALAPDGVIGGGTIMCRNLVAAANVGFTKGARTTLIIGVDHRVVRRTKIREKRLQNLLEAQERYKREFRELTQKKEGQLTMKHKQLKEVLKEKMTNVRPLIESLAEMLENMKSEMTYNEDAMVAATNVFAANCKVEVGGQGVVLESDTMAVGISGRKRRDSHLCTYDEIKSEIERTLAGASVGENSSANSSKPSVPAPKTAAEQPTNPEASEASSPEISSSDTVSETSAAAVEGSDAADVQASEGTQLSEESDEEPSTPVSMSDESASESSESISAAETEHSADQSDDQADDQAESQVGNQSDVHSDSSSASETGDVVIQNNDAGLGAENVTQETPASSEPNDPSSSDSQNQQEDTPKAS
jgi:uncharacterized protein (DUF342 family)